MVTFEAKALGLAVARCIDNIPHISCISECQHCESCNRQRVMNDLERLFAVIYLVEYWLKNTRDISHSVRQEKSSISLGGPGRILVTCSITARPDVARDSTGIWFTVISGSVDKLSGLDDTRHQPVGNIGMQRIVLGLFGKCFNGHCIYYTIICIYLQSAPLVEPCVIL